MNTKTDYYRGPEDSKTVTGDAFIRKPERKIKKNPEGRCFE